MKVDAIVNPVAGGGYAGKNHASILRGFEKYGISARMTKGPMEAVSLAREAVENGSDYLICIGGDGTLNEVSQALAHTDTTLVPVSAGTGSDFVKTLRMNDVESIARALEIENVGHSDLGIIERDGEKRYFLNVLEVGFGAAVMKRVNSRRKVRNGGSFTGSVVSLIPSFHPYEVDLKSARGEEHLSVAEMIIANGRYFGGGMLAAPSADISDGAFDVHIVRGMGKLRMLGKLRHLRDGTYVKDESVISFRTDRMDITGDAPVEIDGEDFGSLPIHISMDRKALRVLMPVERKTI